MTIRFAIDVTLSWLMGFDPARIPVLSERQQFLGAGWGKFALDDLAVSVDGERRPARGFADQLPVRAASRLAGPRRTRGRRPPVVDVRLNTRNMELPFPKSIRRQFAAAEARRQELAAIPEHEWAERQLQALRETWTDASSDIPYYAGLVASGQAPRAINAWSDLHAIPVLRRQFLQERPADFLRRSGPPETFMKTAGSTGLPLRIGMNQAERDRMRVVKLAEWQSLGYTQSSRLFLIWGHAHLLGTGWRGQINHLKRKATDTLLGYRRVDAYRLNRESCEAYAEALIRFRPLGVIGYASALDLFARYTEQYRDRFRALGVALRARDRRSPATARHGFQARGLVRLHRGGGVRRRRIRPGGVQAGNRTVRGLQRPEPPGMPAARRRRRRRRTGAGDDAVSQVPALDSLSGWRRADRTRAPAARPRAAFRRRRRAGSTTSSGSTAVTRFTASRSFTAFTRNSRSIRSRWCSPTTASTCAWCRPAATGRRWRSGFAGDSRRCIPRSAGARFQYVEDLQTSRAGKRRWYVDRRTTIPCVESPAS